MTTGVVEEQHHQNLEKQMGCMAGFLQIFDRHQILTGKRLYSTKRLPPNVVDYSSELEKPPAESPLDKHQQTRSMPSPDNSKHQHNSPAPECSPKSPLPLPVFDLKDGNKSWKFRKEAPRLSLDSRATLDAAKGSLRPKEIRTNAAVLSATVGKNVEDNDKKQQRSPSVIARLMGLEKLPGWEEAETEETKKPELRRSASESRANNRDLQYRFIDSVNFQLKQSQQQQQQSNAIKDEATNISRAMDRKEYNRTARVAHRGIGQRKMFFDSADFFPEPKQRVSIYGEIEKRLKIRGIDEPSKDLETLKQILEALQLKGLLHSKNHRNFTYDNRSFSYDESPIVVMKPSKSSPVMMNRQGNSSPKSLKPRWDSSSPRADMERNGRNQNRTNKNNSRNAVSPVKSPNRIPLTVETQRRVGNHNNSRVSPVQSPKINSRKALTDRSPKNSKQAVPLLAEDESSSSVSDTISTSSHTDTERSRVEGRNLLERCDKLLHSIAEITAAELQPSPVSVLDSSFYKEESSPSPVMKRSCVDFKDHLAELEDDVWSPALSPIKLKSVENSDDYDFIYISDILRASTYLPEDSDVFLLLEKQQYLKGKDTSEVSRLQRKLIFDTVHEILNRKRQLPPWKAKTSISLEQLWSEFQRIRETDLSDDLFEVICSMLKKDLAGDTFNGWEDCPIEMSESVLDIERLIFKDLIGETIRDVAAFTGKCNQATFPRRKLVF